MVPQGAPCWDPEQVRTVMNVDGEALLDEVFAAVDTPYDLWLQSGSEGQLSSLTRDRFLEQFLSPTLPDARAVILGQAGSGKSHLIKWLDVTLKGHPAARNAHVISIPRSGVSLRSILGEIISRLPPDEQPDFQNKLDSAGYRFADDVERRRNLISFLGLAISADRARSTDPRRAAIENWLIGRVDNVVSPVSLSSMFEDPHFRYQWINQTDGVVARIVEHVSGAQPGAVPRDEPISFSEAELPLSGQDLAQLAAPSQAIVRRLASDAATRQVALDLINRNIRTAITRMLNFSGDDLIQLLASVRRSLARQGKWLVLLIEDLARLEGMDQALLEALIERNRPGDAPLCELRWAMAVTKGYFENTALMVRQRVDFIVDMDLRTSGQLSAVTPEQILTFAARYLNATRLGVPALTAWHTANQGTAERAPAPNACLQGPCEYLVECHEAFGNVEEQGLYPFNGTAIQAMLQRFDESARGQFNPRRLLKDVLAEVLAGYHRELQERAFPDVRLRDQFVVPANRLLPVEADRVQRVSRAHAARQMPILELWGGSNQLTVVHPGIYESFGVPTVTTDSRTSPPPSQPTATYPGVVRDALTELIEAIQIWGNGAPLGQNHLDGLRRRVFAAVCDRIDWNGLGVSRSQIAGGAGLPFRAGFISFQDQATTPTQGTITLAIPAVDGPDARSRAALAIGGLLLFERHGSWDSDDGYRMLIVLAEELDAWASSVVEQVRALPDGRGAWNPAPVAAELLALGAVLGSRDGFQGRSTSHVVAAIFSDAEWPEEQQFPSEAWRRMYRQIWLQRTQLRQIVRTWAGGDKGGAQSPFLDPRLVAYPIERLRTGWSLTPVQADVRPKDDRCVALVRLAHEIVERLPDAAHETHQEALRWYEEIEPYLDVGVSRDDLVTLLRAVRTKTANVGGIFAASSEREAVDRALESLGTLDLDGALAAVRMAASALPLASWPLLTPPSVHDAIARSSPSVLALDRFLESVQNRALREINEAQRGGDLRTVRAQIGATLKQLDGLLASIGGAPANETNDGGDYDA